MDPKLITLLVTLATVCVNILFLFTGVTHTVSCTLGEAAASVFTGVEAAGISTSTP